MQFNIQHILIPDKTIRRPFFNDLNFFQRKVFEDVLFFDFQTLGKLFHRRVYGDELK